METTSKILINKYIIVYWRASQVTLVVKNPPANAEEIRDLGLIPGLGRYPGGGHRNLLQYSEEPGGIQSMGSRRVGHDSCDLAHTHSVLEVIYDMEKIHQGRGLGGLKCDIWWSGKPSLRKQCLEQGRNEVRSETGGYLS